MWAPFCDDYTINVPKKKLPRLENWEIIDICGNMIAFGEVYDDPRANEDDQVFVDGHRIRTSKIVEIDPNKKWIQTKNTKHLLGKESEQSVIDWSELMLIMDDYYYSH